MLMRDSLAKSRIIIMPQPPYSPVLTAADLFIFLKLETPMEGKRFATIEEIKIETVGDTKKARLRSVSIIRKNVSINVL